MCVDYVTNHNHKRASPKDGFPLPHIDILVDNNVNHALLSFMNGYVEKDHLHHTVGTFCYTVMPF